MQPRDGVVGDHDETSDLREIEAMAAREVQHAEAVKAQQNDITGNTNRRVSQEFGFTHSMFVDEDYAMMGGHVDNATRVCIINDEYMDFARLLPRDRLIEGEDKQMELVNHHGSSYWVPAEKEGGLISSFYRWEQAFRIYSRIYKEQYPSRATELIQYNYVISSATTSFTWENVYAYDRDFRMHLARHPDRSWGVILQQAWAMRLRDRLSHAGGLHNSNNSSSGQNGSNGRANHNICYKFNRGRCTYGINCKFDHKCAICGKWRHGAVNCRKAAGHKHQKWVNRETGESNYKRRDKKHDRDRDRNDNRRGKEENGSGSKKY